MRTNSEKAHSKPTGLAETLFSNYLRRILALLLLRPDEHYHVREGSFTESAVEDKHKSKNAVKPC